MLCAILLFKHLSVCPLIHPSEVKKSLSREGGRSYRQGTMSLINITSHLLRCSPLLWWSSRSPPRSWTRSPGSTPAPIRGQFQGVLITLDQLEASIPGCPPRGRSGPGTPGSSRTHSLSRWSGGCRATCYPPPGPGTLRIRPIRGQYPGHRVTFS